MSLGFEHLLDKMNVELNELDARGALQKTGTTIKRALTAIPAALRGLYNKMAGVVKSVEKAWFSFHAAIGRLKNNKFALFGRNGNKLTPDLDFMKRVEFSGKHVPMYRYKSAKYGMVEGWLQPNGKVAVAKMHHEGVPLFYLGPTVFNPATIKVTESIISPTEKILLEQILIEAITGKEAEAQFSMTRKESEMAFNVENLVREVVKEKERPLNESVITAADLEDILDDMATAVEAKALGRRKMSLLLYGPPGVGKSQVVETFFEKRGFKVTLLMIQHVPIETLAGFPVIDLEGKMSSHKGVTMMVSDILPESTSKANHLLFLDEFNAGSPEQQKAAMNLALTGKIGTYTLPVNTAIIAAGNAGEIDRATAVTELDAPTFRRFVYKLRVEPDLPSWLKYSRKDTIITYAGDKLNMGPVLPIITRNLVKWAEEVKDPKAPFEKILKGFGGESETGWTDPATWTALDEQMKLRGIKEFKNLPKATQNKLVEIGKKQFKHLKDDLEAGARAYTMGKQDDILKTVGPRILGADSTELVSEMIVNWEDFKRESVPTLDVLLNYKNVRDRVAKSKAIDAEVMMAEMANEIVNFGSKTAMKKYMSNKGIGYYKSSGKDPLAQALMNVGQFVKDLDVGAEIITAHFEALAPAIEMKNQLALDWKAGLLQLGIDRIKAGWNGFLQSIDKQFKDIADADDKAKFVSMKNSGDYFEPIIKASMRIKDAKLRQQFLDTESKNWILHQSKAKKNVKKEEDIDDNEIVITEEMLELAGVK